MGQPHTVGIWRAKPGREDDFIAAWREMATWTTDDVGEIGGGRLLQDQNDPTRFYSFGSWSSNEAIAAWRALPGFKHHLAGMDGLLEDFKTETLELRAEVGDLCATPG